MNKFNLLVFVITFASKVQSGSFQFIKQDQSRLYSGYNPPLHIGFLQHQKDIELFLNGQNNGPLADNKSNQRQLLSFMNQNDPISIESNLYKNNHYEEDQVGRIDYDEMWDKNARKMLRKMTKAKGKWVPIRMKDTKSDDIHLPDDHYARTNDNDNQNYYQDVNSHYNSNRGYSKVRDYPDGHTYIDYLYQNNKKDFSKYMPKSRHHEDNGSFKNMRFPQQNYETDHSKYRNYPSLHEYTDHYRYPGYSRQHEESNYPKYSDDPTTNEEYRYEGYPHRQDEGDDYKYPPHNEGDEPKFLDDNEQSKFVDDNEQSKFIEDNEDFKNIDQSKLSNRTQEKDFQNQPKIDNVYQSKDEDNTNHPKTINQHSQAKEHEYTNFAQQKDYSYHPIDLNNHQVKDHPYSKDTYQPKDSYNFKNDQDFAQFEKYGPQDMNYPYNPNEDDLHDLKDADYGYNPKGIDYSYSPQDTDYGNDKESYEPNHQDLKSKYFQENDHSYKSRNPSADNTKEAKYSNQPEYIEKENYPKEVGHDQEKDVPLNYAQKYSFFKSNPEKTLDLNLKTTNLGSFLYDETLEEVEAVPITQRK